MTQSELERTEAAMAVVVKSNIAQVPAAGTSNKQTRKVPRWFKPIAWFQGFIGIATLAIAWQLIAVHNVHLIPTIGTIFTYLFGHLGLFWRNALVTLQETGIGLGCSFVLAFLTAILMCHARPFERAVMPVVVIMNVTPVVAIAPALVVAFGFSMTPKYIVTGMIVYFPILINSLIGLRSIDPQALDFFRSLHATRWKILFRLRLPSSLPFLFAAARVCFPVSVIGAVVAEFAASGQQRGLGSLIQTAAAYGALPPIYGSIFCLAVIGLALTFAVTFAENRLLSWHSSKRQSL